MAAGCSFLLPVSYSACRKTGRTDILLEDGNAQLYPATAEKP
jgi:hypothetical protein